jgi:hypothetical protein
MIVASAMQHVCPAVPRPRNPLRSGRGERGKFRGMGKEIRAMQDMKVHLEKLQADTAECALISDLAIGR